MQWMILKADFIEKSLLLLVTALLSGFLIPYILKVVDYRKTERQKETEAVLTRQSKVIESQSKFLDDISQYLWQWRYLCIKLTYYAGQKDGTRCEIARDEYDKMFWEVLSKIRNEISRARRLISENVYRDLLTFYEEIVSIDKQLSAIKKEDESMRHLSYLDMNQFIYSEITTKIDDIIHRIALETSLIDSAPRVGGRGTHGDQR